MPLLLRRNDKAILAVQNESSGRKYGGTVIRIGFTGIKTGELVPSDEQ